MAPLLEVGFKETRERPGDVFVPAWAYEGSATFDSPYFSCSLASGSPKQNGVNPSSLERQP